MNDITSPIKIKNISPNISIRKNKNNEKHILISPAHKNYNMNILKSPFKSKSPFNLTKRIENILIKKKFHFIKIQKQFQIMDKIQLKIIIQVL